MTDLRKAAKMALEALETLPAGASYKTHNAASALRKALEQPEQEPFGYFRYDLRLDAWVQNREGQQGTPFYTVPPKREWVGLTDEEIAEGAKQSWVDKQAFESAVWWAEEKLKEKNT